MGAGRLTAQSPWDTFTSSLGRLWHGTEQAPKLAVRHWQVTLPFVVGVGLMMAYGDAPASARIQSPSLQTSSNAWSSHLLLEIEPAYILTAAAVEDRCLFCKSTETFAVATIAAEAYASVAVQALKYSALRERPGVPNDGDGGFYQGGSSFPSGHAIAAFTMASALAHRPGGYQWANWGAYALAGSVASLRFTAKEHFPSDLIVGSTLGELIGKCELRCQ